MILKEKYNDIPNNYSDKAIETFIRKNFNLAFVPVKSTEQNLEDFKFTMNKQLKKLVSNITNYSLIDLIVNPFKNTSKEISKEIKNYIDKQKTKLFISIMVKMIKLFKS